MGYKVRIERSGNRIHLRSMSYISDVWAWEKQLEQIKSIPGARYSSKKWTFPLDLYTCRRMRAVFGNDLVIGPELSKWGRDELTHERGLHGIAHLDPTKPVPLRNVPTMAPTLYAAMLNRGYQTVAAAFGGMAGAHGNFDEPGLGKCVESIGALIESGTFGKGLLIAPKTALSVTWVPELQKWLGDVPGDVLVTLATVQETTTGRLRPATEAERTRAIEEFLEQADDYTYAFLLVNPQMLNTSKGFRCSWNTHSPRHGHPRCGGQYCENKRNHKTIYSSKYPLLNETVWDFAIGDEIHMYGMRGTGQKTSLVGLGVNQIKVKPFRDDDDGVRIPLTGTPLRGKPSNLFAALHWAWPSVYTSRWRFNEQFLKSKPNKYTQSGIEFLEEIRPDAQVALDRELSRRFIRRTKSELRAINPAWAPPPISYVERWVDLTPKQAAAYDALYRTAEVQLGGRVLTTNNILSWMTRLRQLASAEYTIASDGEFVPVGIGAKFEWVVDSYLQRLGITGDPKTEEGDSKVVIASQFTKQIRLWESALQARGIGCHKLTGDEGDDVRVRAQQTFQAPGGPRVFLLNTWAGGVSLTLDAADYGVMMDETWVPDDQDQVEMRLHRTSRTDHYVQWTYVRARGTVEEAVGKENEHKDERSRRVLDARRGVEWARKAWSADVAEAPKTRRRSA